jgi:hypothetical protein
MPSSLIRARTASLPLRRTATGGGFRRDERDLDVFAVLLEVGCGEDVRRKMTYS